MPDDSIVRPTITAWEPLNLQLIVFPVDPLSPPSVEWWQGVTGEFATETSRKRHERYDAGIFQGLTFSLKSELSKVTWMMTPHHEGRDMPDRIPSLGGFPEARDRFGELLLPWLTLTCPPIKRIGLAGTACYRVADHVAAYRLLDALLPEVAIDVDTYDFMYRINKKKDSESGVPGLRLNRIETWSAAKLQIQAHTQLREDQPPTSVFELTEYASMINFDVNTLEDRPEPLPGELLPRLFGELADAASRILERRGGHDGT